MSQRYKYAKALAKQGFNIFRVKSNDKVPLSTGWQKEAKPDATPWSNGSDFNIGVYCGDKLILSLIHI